jgi:hypothetical protein
MLFVEVKGKIKYYTWRRGTPVTVKMEERPPHVRMWGVLSVKYFNGTVNK